MAGKAAYRTKHYTRQMAKKPQISLPNKQVQLVQYYNMQKSIIKINTFECKIK